MLSAAEAHLLQGLTFRNSLLYTLVVVIWVICCLPFSWEQSGPSLDSARHFLPRELPLNGYFLSFFFPSTFFVKPRDDCVEKTFRSAVGEIF